MPEQCICYNCMNQYKKEYGICPFCGSSNDSIVPEPMMLRPGIVLQQRYVVGKALGHGGFSVTYLGYDTNLQIRVAIKEYLPSEYATRVSNANMVTVSQEPEDVDRYIEGINKFMQEAQRIASLDNIEGIVKVFDAFMENSTAYIIREYLEGETIQEKLKKEGRLKPDKTFEMLIPLLDSLERVHRVGILHRDISPDNIIYTNEDTIKLIDFGAARKMPKGKSRSLSVFIKPGYTPVEQYTTNGEQGTWTDVYALAATIYKMITGITPPDGLQRKGKDTMKAPSKLGVKISRNAENAILNAMNVSVKKRTQTAAQFKQQLYSTKEVRRIQDQGDKNYLGGIPKWAKIAGIGLAVLCVGVVGLAASGVMKKEISFTSEEYSIPEGKVLVPSFVNLTKEQAEEKAENNQLELKIVDAGFRDDVPAGKIFEQSSPQVGEIVDAETTVVVNLSRGPDMVLLPSVHYLDKEKALQMLKDSGFDVEVEQKEAYLKADLVAGTDLEELRQYKRGTKVVLTVSKGAEVDKSQKVMVPDFGSGRMSVLDAIKLAEETGLMISVNYELKPDMKADMVISQSVAKNKRAYKGSEITLKVSRGYEKQLVSSVEGLTLEWAQKEMKKLNMNLKISYDYDESVTKGHIFYQDLKNIIVKEGSTIELTVSLGKKPSSASAVTSKPTQIIRNYTTPTAVQETHQQPEESSKSTQQASGQTSKTVQQSSKPVQQSSKTSQQSSKTVQQSSKTSQQSSKPVQQSSKPSTTPSSAPPQQSSATTASNSIIDSGTCGDNVTWTLDQYGTLTISGNTPMHDYDKGTSPWYNNRTSIKTVNIQNVTHIGNGAFYYCTSLTSITIPDSVMRIGYWAFQNCTSLTSITLPDTVDLLGEAFCGCTSLTSITIPKRVTYIETSTFRDCTSLTSITIPGSVEYIEMSAFCGCTSLTSIIIPDSVKWIEEGAFDGCTSLKSITVKGRTEIPFGWDPRWKNGCNAEVIFAA